MMRHKPTQLLLTLVACLFLASAGGMTHEHTETFDASCLICGMGSLASDDVPAPLLTVDQPFSTVKFDSIKVSVSELARKPFHARAPPALA